MGRFPGGSALPRNSRSEIDVRVLAPAIVATTKSPCHQNRDSFDTISGDRCYGKWEARANLAFFCHDCGVVGREGPRDRTVKDRNATSKRLKLRRTDRSHLFGIETKTFRCSRDHGLN